MSILILLYLIARSLNINPHPGVCRGKRPYRLEHGRVRVPSPLCAGPRLALLATPGGGLKRKTATEALRTQRKMKEFNTDLC